jgi:TP901 family phage tail tape measure protein
LSQQIESLLIEIEAQGADRALGGLERGMGRVGDRAVDLEGKTKRLGTANRGLGSSMAGVDRAMMSQIRQLAVMAAGYIGIHTAIRQVASAAKLFADFEYALAAVEAVSQSTRSEMAALTAQARELGETTMFTASQAGNAMEFLGRAGFKANEILSAMPGLLNLAAAGKLGLADAANIAAQSLRGFNLGAGESTRVADVLASAAANANTDVSQMGEGMVYVAPVAAALGISIERTAAAMGVLSDAGLQSTMAGTGLRRVLSELANPSKAAQVILKGLGLTVAEVDPLTNHLADVVGRLADAGISAADALTIFGDRGGPAMLALTAQAPRLRELTTVLEASEGAAERMAGTMMDTLVGANFELASAIESVKIELGTGLEPSLREAAKELTVFFRGSGDSARDFGTQVGQMVVALVRGFLFVAEHIQVVKAAIVGLLTAFVTAKVGGLLVVFVAWVQGLQQVALGAHMAAAAEAKLAAAAAANSVVLGASGTVADLYAAQMYGVSGAVVTTDTVLDLYDAQLIKTSATQAAATVSAGAHAAATNVVTGATLRSAFATSVFGVALQRLKLAILSNPIGLIATALALLVGVLLLVRARTAEAAEAQDQYAERLRYGTPEIEAQTRAHADLIDRLEEEIRVRREFEALGSSSDARLAQLRPVLGQMEGALDLGDAKSYREAIVEAEKLGVVFQHVSMTGNSALAQLRLQVQALEADTRKSAAGIEESGASINSVYRSMAENVEDTLQAELAGRREQLAILADLESQTADLELRMSKVVPNKEMLPTLNAWARKLAELRGLAADVQSELDATGARIDEQVVPNLENRLGDLFRSGDMAGWEDLIRSVPTDVFEKMFPTENVDTIVGLYTTARERLDAYAKSMEAATRRGEAESEEVAKKREKYRELRQEVDLQILAEQASAAAYGESVRAGQLAVASAELEASARSAVGDLLKQDAELLKERIRLLDEDKQRTSGAANLAALRDLVAAEERVAAARVNGAGATEAAIRANELLLAITEQQTGAHESQLSEIEEAVRAWMKLREAAEFDARTEAVDRRAEQMEALAAAWDVGVAAAQRLRAEQELSNRIHLEAAGAIDTERAALVERIATEARFQAVVNAQSSLEAMRQQVAEMRILAQVRREDFLTEESYQAAVRRGNEAKELRTHLLAIENQRMAAEVALKARAWESEEAYARALAATNIQFAAMSAEAKSLIEIRAKLATQDDRVLDSLKTAQRAWGNFVQGMQRDLAGAFENLFDDGLDSFADFFDQVLSMAKSFVSEWLAYWTIAGGKDLWERFAVGGTAEVTQRAVVDISASQLAEAATAAAAALTGAGGAAGAQMTAGGTAAGGAMTAGGTGAGAQVAVAGAVAGGEFTAGAAAAGSVLIGSSEVAGGGFVVSTTQAGAILIQSAAAAGAQLAAGGAAGGAGSLAGAGGAAAGAGGFWSGAMGGSIAALWPLAVAAAVIIAVDWYNDKQRNKRFTDVGSFGVVDGERRPGGFVGETGKLVEAWEETLDAIEELTGGVVESLPEISLQIRRDGKAVRAYVEGALLGTFKDLGTAAAAALRHALKFADIAGVTDEILQVLRAPAEDIEELMANIAIVQRQIDLSLDLSSFETSVRDFLRTQAAAVKDFERLGVSTKLVWDNTIEGMKRFYDELRGVSLDPDAQARRDLDFINAERNKLAADLERRISEAEFQLLRALEAVSKLAEGLAGRNPEMIALWEQLAAQVPALEALLALLREQLAALPPAMSPEDLAKRGGGGRQRADERQEARERIEELSLLAGGMSDAALAMRNVFVDFDEWAAGARKLGIAEADLAQARLDNLTITERDFGTQFDRRLAGDLGGRALDLIDEYRSAWQEAIEIAKEAARVHGTSFEDELARLGGPVAAAFAQDLSAFFRDELTGLIAAGDVAGLRRLLEVFEGLAGLDLPPELLAIVDGLQAMADEILAAIAAVQAAFGGVEWTEGLDVSGIQEWIDRALGIGDAKAQLRELALEFAAVYAQARLLGATEAELAIIREAERLAIDDVRASIMETVQEFTDAALGISEYQRSLMDLQDTFRDAREGLAAVDDALGGAGGPESGAIDPVASADDQMRRIVSIWTDGLEEIRRLTAEAFEAQPADVESAQVPEGMRRLSVSIRDAAAAGRELGLTTDRLGNEFDLLADAERIAIRQLGHDFIGSLDALGVSLPTEVVWELARAEFALAQVQAVSAAMALAAAGAFEGLTFTLDELLGWILGASFNASNFAPRVDVGGGGGGGGGNEADPLADALRDVRAQIRQWQDAKLDPVTREVVDLTRTFYGLRDALLAAGGSTQDLIALEGEYEDAVARVLEAALQPIRDAQEEIRNGPQVGQPEAYETLRARFQETLAAVQGGDFSRIQELSTLAVDLRNAGAGMFGTSTGAFRGLAREIDTALQGLLDAGIEIDLEGIDLDSERNDTLREIRDELVRHGGFWQGTETWQGSAIGYLQSLNLPMGDIAAILQSLQANGIPLSKIESIIAVLQAQNVPLGKLPLILSALFDNGFDLDSLPEIAWLAGQLHAKGFPLKDLPALVAKFNEMGIPLSSLPGIFAELDAQGWDLSSLPSILQGIQAIQDSAVRIDGNTAGLRNITSSSTFALTAPQLDVGGRILREGLAHLHAGEVVLTPDQTRHFYSLLDTARRPTFEAPTLRPPTSSVTAATAPPPVNVIVPPAPRRESTAADRDAVRREERIADQMERMSKAMEALTAELARSSSSGSRFAGGRERP